MLNIGVKRDKQLICALYFNNTTNIWGYSVSENIGVSAMINIVVSAYRQKPNIGTPLHHTPNSVLSWHLKLLSLPQKYIILCQVLPWASLKYGTC